MVTFGEWLRQQRDHMKLTRKEFSDRVGCSVALLRKIEDGERRPSPQIAELIANSLNISPTARANFIKVARGELSVERLTPGSRPAATATPQSNLPVLPTPLIGRQREVDELNRLLRDPACRLLTLAGPGGIGKTRLAIAAAAQLQDNFADGVYFIPFTPVNAFTAGNAPPSKNAARFIVPVIADAVGFAFESTSGSDPKTQLFNYLRGKQVLLLVDNLEQLLAGPGIETLAELLESAPEVKLLATSRESLGLQMEWVYEVRGLPVPESSDVEGGAQDTSVELFLQRARRVNVGFDATPADYPAIVRICHMVDGMPLGIELAAAWVRALTCEEIAMEIERGLDFLSVSARDLPARHRSMRAVFDHSWRLLAEEEQGVLLRLSLFQGGFRREAAEAVAGATLSTLSSLVTKSLIRRSGTGRYDLHELIRQFAAQQFAEYHEDQAAAQACHAGYYLNHFSQADEQLRSAAQRETLAGLTAEMDNFRAAWDWAVAHGEFALMEQTLRTIAIFCDIRGWYQEGLDLLEPAVTAVEAAHQRSAPGKAEQVALGHLLACQGLLTLRMAQYEQATAMLERSLEILRSLNETHVLVEPATFLGFVMALTGNYARASELYTEGLEIAILIGDRWFAALCRISLIDMGSFMVGSIKPADAYERFQAVVAEWRAIGDPRFTALALNALSMSALQLERYNEARLALEESVALSSSVGDGWGLGFAYRGLGFIEQARGEHLQAVAMFRKSLETLIGLGARQDVARVRAEMGWSVFALGDDSEAGRLWGEALRITNETGGVFIALEALVGLASLKAKQGQKVQALVFLLAVLDHPASVQKIRDRADRLRIELKAQLTRQQIEAALAQEKTFETVMNEALAQFLLFS